MFNSLDAGFVPIGNIVVAISWFVARARLLWVRGLLSVLVPIAISFAWGFLPRLPDVFRPLRFGEDDRIPWILMAVMTWSAVSVPVGAIAVILFSLWRKRFSKSERASPL
jgi:hypothetical protein